MWPGIVGKGPGSEPIISLDQMIALTRNASVNGSGFDGIDLNLAPFGCVDSLLAGR